MLRVPDEASERTRMKVSDPTKFVIVIIMDLHEPPTRWRARTIHR